MRAASAKGGNASVPVLLLGLLALAAYTVHNNFSAQRQQKASVALLSKHIVEISDVQGQVKALKGELEVKEKSLADVRTERDSLLEEKAALASRAEEQRAAVRRLEGDKASLASAVADRDRELSELTRKSTEQQQHIDELEAAKTEARRSVAELEAKVASTMKAAEHGVFSETREEHIAKIFKQDEEEAKSMPLLEPDTEPEAKPADSGEGQPREEDSGRLRQNDQAEEGAQAEEGRAREEVGAGGGTEEDSGGPQEATRATARRRTRRARGSKRSWWPLLHKGAAKEGADAGEGADADEGGAAAGAAGDRDEEFVRSGDGAGDESGGLGSDGALEGGGMEVGEEEKKESLGGGWLESTDSERDGPGRR